MYNFQGTLYTVQRQVRTFLFTIEFSYCNTEFFQEFGNRRGGVRGASIVAGVLRRSRTDVGGAGGRRYIMGGVLVGGKDLLTLSMSVAAGFKPATQGTNYLFLMLI